MASLRDTVREYQDDLRSGIAWLAFWREGRSWHGEAFRLDMSDYLYPEDKMRLSEIQAADPKAVVVNGYYSGYLGEKMSVDELAAGVRHHYQNGLRNIAPFMEAHDDVLPPEVLEEARAKAHEAGLPFYERPYNGEDIDPYVYDGNMSVEDYELMHRLMEQDNERSDRVNEVFPIQLHNRQLYEQGKDGVWLDMPTTTEQLQAALRQIGISADNPQDFFINGYSYPEGQRLALPYDMVLAADVDELNFLAARLGQLDAAEIAELNAALQNPKGGFENIGQIIDFTENADYYVHLPDVHTAAALGDYYLNRSGMVDMPQEWKSGIDTTQFGRYIAQQEQGAFTEYGYIVKSGDKWQRVHEGQPVYACEQEQAVLADPDKNLSVQFQGGGLHLKADMLLKDGETFEAAGYTFQMLHTPGHTEGSCCYYVKSEKVLFSGDTLFEGSYGRIDFPTGSGRQMIHSVADILLNLPDDTNVYPGHMGYTTIADEKQYNPLAGYRGREA